MHSARIGSILDYQAMSLLNHELVHLLLTSLVAVFVCVLNRKKKQCQTTLSKPITDHRSLIADYLLLITVIFIIGIFLDVDHLFDYLLWSKGTFILSDFLNPSLYVHLSGKVYIPLHGFDVGIIVFFVSGWLENRFKLHGLSLALTLSYFVHLLWDNFSFDHHPFAYFFIHRLLNGFSVGSFDG